jgi:hypothetical protein
MKGVRTTVAAIVMAMTAVPGPGVAQQDSEAEESAVRYDVTSDVLADPGQVTLDLSVAVQNSTDLNDQPQRSPNTNITQVQPNFRTLYSVTSALDLELQVSGNHTVNQVLATAATGPGTSTSDTRFGTVSAGARYLFVKEGAHPALQGFFAVNVVENTTDDTIFAKSGNVGLRLRKSVDPMVVRTSLTYIRRGERDRQGARFDPADTWASETSLDLFINDKFALTGRIGLEVFEDDEFAGQDLERQRIGIPLSGGVRYTVSQDVLLSLSGEVDTTRDSTRFDLGLQYIL